MTEDRHCGYANYQTFTIGVVVDNDQQLYNEARMVAALADEESETLSEVADAIRSWVEERFIDPVCKEGATHHGIAATLCAAALGEVDWLELAADWSDIER